MKDWLRLATIPRLLAILLAISPVQGRGAGEARCGKGSSSADEISVVRDQ